MGDNDNLRLQQEINTNMSVASQQPFAVSNEEQAFSMQQVRGGFNRVGRRKTDQQKIEHQRDTQEWVNKTQLGNNLQIGTAGGFKMAENWVHNVNQEDVVTNQQNNRTSSESIETIRENIKNSQESLKQRSCESLTIEEAHKISKTSSGSSGKIDNKADDNSENVKTNLASPRTRDCEHNKTSEVEIRDCEITVSEDNQRTVNDTARRESGVSYQDNNTNRRASMDSTDSLNESTCDLSRSYRSLAINDPYTAAIDLSNKCRQFYFNHQKAAEAIKQSVRSAKHTRAKEKMEGKSSSGIDCAMDRLRAEMADLMDQDLSLMSQLLKLNDKIEEVKTHVAYRHRQDSFSSQSSCYLSGSEMSDSEFEDNDDSKLDLSHSARTFKIQAKENTAEPQTENEVVLRRLEPTDSQIIVYKKKKARNGKRRGSKDKVSLSRSDTDDEADDEGDEKETGSDSLSDTESTLSYTSGTTINGSDQSDDAEQSPDVLDSGIQSPDSQKLPEEPPSPKKGGISQNRKFLNFHKKNGNFTKSVITGLNVLTMQGHNVPLDKYFVPQGLVYLKQEKSENVFCQFTK